MKILNIVLLLMLTSSCGDYNSSLPSEKTGTPQIVSGTDPFSAEELSSINSGAFEKPKLLMNLGLNVLYPATLRFYKDALHLNTTVRNLCFEYRSSTDHQAIEEKVKSKWKNAMESYHYLEGMMVGPIADLDFEKRYKLYSFALTRTNECSIDKEIVKLHNNPNISYRTSFNRTGLDALEYLLHSPATFTCKRPRGDMNAWGKLPLNQRKISKCAYLSRTSDYLLKNAKELKVTWDPSGLNLTKSIIERNIFGNLDESINTFSDALFYLDGDLKDHKLALPLGLSEDCSTEKCPQSVEHIKTNFSINAIHFNLLGFKALFNGNDLLNSRSLDGFGFDDFLKNSNATHLEKRMNKNLDVAIENTRKLLDQDLKTLIQNMDKTSCLQTTSENRLVEICAIYKDIKKVSDDLKNDFLVYLALKAPRQAQGDND
jgi:predicted lipoprotein